MRLCFHRTLKRRKRRVPPHYWYYVNLEDPNERGYDAIRRMFLIQIAKTLQQ